MPDTLKERPPREVPASNDPALKFDRDLLLRMHRIMVRTRVLEERLIKMSKGGEGFFWIGGPGEEAFNVPLGFLIKKGSGVENDFLHFHYRSSATLLAMGADPVDSLRQMRSTGTDPYSKGRQFVNHYAIPEWNVVPVSPTIETQYLTAIGTGIAQARAGGEGITIVTGGDAGTAEGDFHSCLVWANRPALRLPILMLVVNNGYGISTPWRDQFGLKKLSDWSKAFDMPGKTIDGNDPIVSYHALKEAMAYVRKERKPYLLEAQTSRLYGHSSSSGANRVAEPDCIPMLEERLIRLGLGTQEQFEGVWLEERNAVHAAHQTVRQEPYPDPASIWDDVFSGPLPESYPRKGGS